MKRMTIVALFCLLSSAVNMVIAISANSPLYYFFGGLLLGCAVSVFTILISDAINGLGDGAIPKRE